MAEQLSKSWLRGRIENGLHRGFQRAYKTVRVDPSTFLLQLRSAYGLPVTTFAGLYSLDVRVLDQVAEKVIRGGMKIAAVEGAGFGLGGVMTIVPDLGILAAVTLRTIQKLSLIYGFEFNTDDETAELWIAAATAAGVDISREMLEKEVISKFVPRVIQRIAVKASTEVVEKWAGRVIPLVSSVIGAGLNYYFVRAWGKRAGTHFRQRHLEIRNQMLSARNRVLDAPPAVRLTP
ncbi:MAG TPA: EcsC family protein [Terriglobales bacterium]|nr:EcsC family protein [Terriglobales bacterium]